MAGDTDTDTTVGTQRFLTTTPNNVTSGPENGVIGGLWTNLDAMVTGVNNILPGAPGSGDSTSSNGLWGQSGTNFANAGSWFGAGFNNINALGTAANLYVIANSSDESLDISRAYKAVFGLQLLADGTLKSVGSQVPLPAGIWLLGSALAGLAGIGRRRALQTAAAA
jgi:hypothetical protein